MESLVNSISSSPQFRGLLLGFGILFCIGCGGPDQVQLPEQPVPLPPPDAAQPLVGTNDNAGPGASPGPTGTLKVSP